MLLEWTVTPLCWRPHINYPPIRQPGDIMVLILHNERVRRWLSLLSPVPPSEIAYGIAANDSSLQSVAKDIWRGRDESPFEAMVIAC